MRRRYTKRAIAQIAEILEAAADDTQFRRRFLNRVEGLASLLSRQPLIGRPTDIANVRAFAIRPFPYLMFYRIEHGETGITVLCIRDMAREADWRAGC
jgi:plasmid stabilization system protein ParE